MSYNQDLVNIFVGVNHVPLQTSIEFAKELRKSGDDGADMLRWHREHRSQVPAKNHVVDIMRRCSSPACYSEWHLVGYCDFESAVAIHDPFQTRGVIQHHIDDAFDRANDYAD